MDKFDRIYALHQALATSREPVAQKILEEKLHCNNNTVNQIVEDSRNYLEAPIKYDKRLNGYYYDKINNQEYQLPGLWFNASELHALLAAYQLLSNVKPGFLEPHIAPLKDRIEHILKKEKHKSSDIFKRIRILQMGSRDYEQKQFAIVATALLSDKRLYLHYHGREKNMETQRLVSPQRLVHYRDNWYLDAWCHERQGLRNFALDRIKQAKLDIQPAKTLDENTLNSHYADAYGIFGGQAKDTAKLRFTPNSAQWVAAEQWHSKQVSQFELDGSYVLQIPFSDPRELLMDIMKYGPEVEVLAPESLRKQLIERLQQSLDRYKT